MRKENSLTDFQQFNPSKNDFPSTIWTSSEEETFDLGKKIARLLKKGSIVGLKGTLGAGKTCLARGIVSGLEVEEAVTSPSYTIVSEFRGFPYQTEPVPVYHIDAYRLNGSDDFSDLGGEEIVFGNGISIIEWVERIPFFIIPGTIIIDMEIIKDEKRLIRITIEGMK